MTINSLSKTYSLTGWRVGWAIASPPLSDAIRKVHDFLTVGAAAPLQEAAVVALGLSEDYHRQLAADYRKRRDVLLPALEQAGFSCFKPDGAYYIMTDISGFGFSDDTAFARHLIETEAWPLFRARASITVPKTARRSCGSRFASVRQLYATRRNGSLR